MIRKLGIEMSKNTILLQNGASYRKCKCRKSFIFINVTDIFISKDGNRVPQELLGRTLEYFPALRILLHFFCQERFILLGTRNSCIS
jgi:hypothetical protein